MQGCFVASIDTFGRRREQFLKAGLGIRAIFDRAALEEVCDVLPVAGLLVTTGLTSLNRSLTIVSRWPDPEFHPYFTNGWNRRKAVAIPPTQTVYTCAASDVRL